MQWFVFQYWNIIFVNVYSKRPSPFLRKEKQALFTYIKQFNYHLYWVNLMKQRRSIAVTYNRCRDFKWKTMKWNTNYMNIYYLIRTDLRQTWCPVFLFRNRLDSFRFWYHKVGCPYSYHILTDNLGCKCLYYILENKINWSV